jgi:tetratricopeptide (TPR) repeat protein
MNLKEKNREKRKKNMINMKSVLFSTLFYLCSLFYFLSSSVIFAQDSIPIAKDVTEEKDLKFQEFFFKALTEKAIGNYQKAIENLEACNQIATNNTTVFFEFSKNYFSLNKTFLAKEYINKALESDPENTWMLTHLVAILKKERNFSKAISVQKKIASNNPKKRDQLVQLYIQNKEYDTALELLQNLENEQLLTSKLRYLKTNLENKKFNSKVNKVKKPETKNNLFAQFEANKKYETLEKILKKHKNNPSILQKYSEKGMALFPAQPFVYLINAITLNEQQNYKKAILVLENGIDFVIEEKVEIQFYKAFIKAYLGLGNTIKEEEYKKKLKKLKS